MDNNPLVSVIIPVYNAQKYIEQAIISVNRQMYDNIEIIVVDDGSTDNTPSILRRLSKNIHIITQENKGPAAARNAGISVAKGQIIAFLDADDLWTNTHIKDMLPYVVGDSPYDAVTGTIEYIRDVSTGIDIIPSGSPMTLVMGSYLFKSSIFSRVGLFDETMRQGGEDLDWRARFLESGCRQKIIDVATLYYRRHENNLTVRREIMEKGQLHALRNKLARAKAKLQIS